MKGNDQKGFTLLELLIVIAILGVLSAVAIFVLNPAETLREARDTQRVSDLATLKTALALYITKTTSTVSLDGSSNTLCANGSGTDSIFYSYPSDNPGAPIADATLAGGSANVPTSTQVMAASSSLTNGTGWIKVNLSGLTSGSPISDLPVDPTNSATAGGVTNSDLVYRYMCDAADNTFELNAKLESSSVGNKATKDGGNNSNLYEVGTKLLILPASNDF